MSRAVAAYRKDLPAGVRLSTSFAPHDYLTVEQAEKLVEEIRLAVVEAREFNEKRPTK